MKYVFSDLLLMCFSSDFIGFLIIRTCGHLDAKDNIYPRKERAENKIDGIVALIMALSRAIKPRDSVVLGSDYELMLL